MDRQGEVRHCQGGEGGNRSRLIVEGYQINRSQDQGEVTKNPRGSLPEIDRVHKRVTVGVHANNRSEV